MRLGKRTLGLLLSVVVLSLFFGGYGMAQTLTEQSVSQSANTYGVSTTSVANFPTAPTVGVGTPWTWTTACNASGATLTDGTWLRQVVGINGSAPVCAAGDFAEVWTFPGNPTTMVAQTDTWTFYATWTGGDGHAYSTSVSFSVSVPAGNNNGAGVSLALDYGQASVPASLGSLSVVVS